MAKVWLYGSATPQRLPSAVRDDRFHVWTHECDDVYCTLDGHHRERWPDLVAHSDLVEVAPNQDRQSGQHQWRVRACPVAPRPPARGEPQKADREGSDRHHV